MEQTVQPIQRRNAPKGIIFFLIALVVLGVVLYTARSRGYLTSQQVMPSPTAVPTADPNLWMKMVSETGATQFTQADQVRLKVNAASSSRDIEGYDVLISFDPAYFDVVSTRSLNPNFQVVPFNKKGMISVTGTKSPSFTGQLILNNTDILSVVLKPKQKGTTTVTIQSVAGPEKTKMVDVNSQILLPQLTSITLAIY